MDLNDVRVAVTLVSFGLFIALLVHTYSRRRRDEHAQAQWLPFGGEPGPAPGGAADASQGRNP